MDTTALHPAQVQNGASKFVSACFYAPTDSCVGSLRQPTVISRASKPPLSHSEQQQNKRRRLRQQWLGNATPVLWPSDAKSLAGIVGTRGLRQRSFTRRAVNEDEQQHVEAEQSQPFFASKLFRAAPVVLFTLGFIDAG